MRTTPDASHRAGIPINSNGDILQHTEHCEDGALWAAPYASIQGFSAHLMALHVRAGDI